MKNVADPIDPQDVASKSVMDKMGGGAKGRTFDAVSAGATAVIYLTDDGTAGGNALFSSVNFMHAKFVSSDPTLGCAYPTISGDLKTLTVGVVKQTFNVISLLSTNILGSVSTGNPASGTALKVLVQGTLV